MPVEILKIERVDGQAVITTEDEQMIITADTIDEAMDNATHYLRAVFDALEWLDKRRAEEQSS